MNIKTRKMRPSDINIVSKLYYEAFHKKAVLLDSLSRKELISIFRYSLFHDKRNLDNFIVAVTEDNKPVGFIQLIKHDSHNTFTTPRIENFIKVGFKKMLKQGIAFSRIDFKPEPHQLYIEALAVAPSMRSKGVGSSLLKYADQVVRENPTLTQVALSVIGKNKNAHRLYARKGFRAVTSQKDPWADKYCDVQKTILMVKEEVK